MRLRDGGGVGSDADWFSPRAADWLGALRRRWMRLIHDWQLVSPLRDASAVHSKSPWLCEDEILELRSVLVSFLRDQGYTCSACVADGQPLALELWEALFKLTNDVDGVLPGLLEHGVPTGILETIPPSDVWRKVDVTERPDLDLRVFDMPWGSALDDPETVFSWRRTMCVQASLPGSMVVWKRPGDCSATIAQPAS